MSSFVDNINNKTEEEQIKVIQVNGLLIRRITNPSQALQIEAVKQCPMAIKFIKNPSYEVITAAIGTDPFAIQYIENPPVGAINMVLSYEPRLLELFPEYNIYSQGISVITSGKLSVYPYIDFEKTNEQDKSQIIFEISKCGWYLNKDLFNPDVTSLLELGETELIMLVEANPHFYVYIKNPTQAITDKYNEKIALRIEHGQWS